MPKFLIEASYSAEGLRGLAKDKASGRQAVVKEALASVGGKLEATYFALGDATSTSCATAPTTSVPRHYRSQFRRAAWSAPRPFP